MLIKMKITAVVGSMRENGNSEVLTDLALDSAKLAGADVTKVVLRDDFIKGCDGCDYCREKGICKKSDTLANVLNILKESDGILFASPVYFWSVSSQIKALMDRSYSLFITRQLKGKIAGFIVVARRGGASEAFSLLNNFANKHRMHVAGGVIAYGNKKGEVLKDIQGIKEAQALGKAMVNLYNKIH